MTELWGQQNSDTYIKQAVYSYGSDGNCARADQFGGNGNIKSWRESMRFGGNTLSELSNDDPNPTQWTDYIYAGGKRIAKLGAREPVIRTASAGATTGDWQVTCCFNTGAINTYTVHDQDRLVYRQRTHSRTIEFADIAVVSADGSVHPIYNAEGSMPMSQAGSAGVTPGSAGVAQMASTWESVHYYASDHLGTAQMELTAGGGDAAHPGYPVWKGEFAPFGQELSDPSTTANRYKFTGKERDAESGLDYFGARYYSSNMGRWMSPDWSAKEEPVPYAKLDDPQSLNLYGYVLNSTRWLGQ